MINNQLNEMMSILKQMDTTVKQIETMTQSEFAEAGFKLDIADDLAKFTREQVEAFTPKIFMSMYDKYKRTNHNVSYPEEYDPRAAKIREAILDIYDSAISYKDLVKQRDDLAKEVHKALEDYSAYLSSNEMKEREAQQLADLKDQIRVTEDEREKKKLMNRLKILDDSESLEFFFERIDSYGERELNSIMDSFFNKRRAEYTMSKYVAKMKYMNYRPEMFKSLIDIEANFLDESYAPYNNLFLFAFIRYIAYTDTNSEKEVLYAQTLIMKITKFVFHKLEKDQEECIIGMIKRFDSKFVPYHDQFVEKNLTSPLSSYRIEMEAMRKEETLNNISAWFVEHNIELPESYSYEEKIAYMKEMQETLSLKNWLDMYEIEYDPEATREELQAIKDSYDALPKKDEEVSKESDSDDKINEEFDKSNENDSSSESLNEEVDTISDVINEAKTCLPSYMCLSNDDFDGLDYELDD